MEALNVALINITAPYKVWNEGPTYRFETEHGISYVVDFDTDDNPFFTCYWFNLTNPKNFKSPGDIKIAQTVICIIEEFFRVNPDVLLYMCSTDKRLSVHVCFYVGLTDMNNNNVMSLRQQMSTR